MQRKLAFSKCDDLINHLEEHYPSYKKSGNFYPIIRPYLDIALINSEWLHMENQNDIARGIPEYNLDSFTSFDKLIIHLRDVVSS